jgi:bacterioferritin (cytochrome b1)
MLGFWGSVLQLAEGPEQQQEAIQLIGEDVNELLEKELLAAEIQDVRYEQRLGLRLFDGL